MDLGNMGTHAGSGIVGAILGYFGISKRLDSIEEGLKDRVTQAACAVCSRSNDARHTESMDMLKEIREDIKEILKGKG